MEGVDKHLEKKKKTKKKRVLNPNVIQGDEKVF
jgi:hypothetical protein